MTVRDWIDAHVYTANHVGLESDEIIVMRLSSGKILVLAEVNLLGGVCDDCKCRYLGEKITSWYKQKILFAELKG